MDSCPLCGLALEDVDDHTRRAHQAALVDIEATLTAGLAITAAELTRDAALYGARIPNLRPSQPDKHAMREGGYL